MLYCVKYDGSLFINSLLWAAMSGVLACEAAVRSYWCERMEMLHKRSVVLVGNTVRVSTVWETVILRISGKRMIKRKD